MSKDNRNISLLSDQFMILTAKISTCIGEWIGAISVFIVIKTAIMRTMIAVLSRLFDCHSSGNRCPEKLALFLGRFQNVCDDLLQNLTALGLLDLGKRNQRIVSVFLRLLFRKRNAVMLDDKRANPRDIVLR